MADSEDTTPSALDRALSIGSRNHLSAFPGLPSFQLLPSLDRTSLHTDHVLVSVERGEIADVLRVHPWIPNNNFIQIISDDAEPLLSSFVDNDWGIWSAGRSVHSVCCAGYGNGRRWRGSGADWDGYFVHVFGGFEAGD